MNTRITHTLILVMVSAFSYAGNIIFDHIDMRSGLSNPTINSIYQDENDVIWIATRDGLNRYNQGRIDVFRPEIGDTARLFGNNIQSVCGDGAGHLYIQCLWGFVEYNQQQQTFHKIATKNIVNISYGSHNLWVCSSNAVFAYNRDKSTLDKYIEFDYKDRLTCIRESQGQLYIGTRDGLILLDQHKIATQLIPGIEVICIYEDGRKNIWIGTLANGLYKIETSGKITIYKHDAANPASISNNYIRSICEDNLGNYWIGTSLGLNRLDSRTGKFTCYTHSETDANSISNSSIWTIMKDRQGTLWIGTFYGGIDLFNPEYSFAEYYKAAEKELSFPVVGKIVEYDSNNLWIATDGGGLNHMCRTTGHVTHFVHGQAAHTLPSNIIKDILPDYKAGALWLGTHLGGLCRFDIATGEIKPYSLPKELGLGSNDIRCVESHKGLLYLGTKNSVIVFNPTTGNAWQLIEDFVSESKQIWNMMIDSEENLWFSTSFAIFRYNLQSNELKKYIYDQQQLGNIGENYQNTFFQDNQGNIWLGSAGSGMLLYVPENDTFTPYNTKNCDIIGDYIVNITQSAMGYLLVATNKGFSRIDTRNMEFHNYQIQDISPLTAINERGLCITQKGEIVIGGFNGMVIIDEADLDFEKKDFKINFSDLRVNNRQVLPQDGTDIIDKAIVYTPKVLLKHNHTSIAIEFSVSNYARLLKNAVEYKLEGFDNNWISAQNSNRISYTNLSPGQYTLRVRSTDQRAENSLSIIVKPPLYATWYAYLFYTLVAFTIIFYLLRSYASQIKLKTSLEYANKETARIEELNQSKLRFFTNISHELRTPVTLIMSQIEILIEGNNISKSAQGKLASVMKNVKKMQQLINEILDFRKQEQGFLVPKVHYIDFAAFISEVYNSFKEYAASKHIEFNLSCPDGRIDLWFDPTQMEKVFYNLLSNAFKFTPENGTIDITVEVTENTVEIAIADTGIGIPKDKQPFIFDRFYQVDYNKHHRGTGIGLALVKGIIDGHNGRISVESEANRGSTFRVSLLLGSGHFDNIDYTTGIETYQLNYDVEGLFDSVSASNVPTDNSATSVSFEMDSPADAVIASTTADRPRILIVEDNPELLNILNGLFSPIYTVFLAHDGEEGLEEAGKQQPDIILSDVMMPRMSGVELCRRIKTNLETAHIPVVLLTARSAIEHTIEGFKTGADDYIIKPFNNKLLITRCNNLINNRKAIQAMFSKNVDIKTDMLAINVLDQELLDKAIKVVEENLTNPQFDVNAFAETLNLGRTSLFSKLKGITGQTPNEFIMSIRLKKGVHLLKNNPELNVSDIAFQIGFSEATYFVKCFKGMYGKTPLQFRKEIKKEK